MKIKKQTKMNRLKTIREKKMKIIMNIKKGKTKNKNG